MQRLKEMEQRTAQDEEDRRARESEEAMEDEEILKVPSNIPVLMVLVIGVSYREAFLVIGRVLCNWS